MGFSQDGVIKVISHYQDNNLCFRLGVDIYKDYESIKMNGLNISRRTLIQGNDTLSKADQLLSIVNIATGMKPKSEQWMIDSLPDTEFSTLLKTALYAPMDGANINYQSPRLVDAVNLEKTNEGRLFGIMFAVESDFNLAKAAALGVIDESAQPGRLYQYTFSVNDTTGQNIIKPIAINVSTFVEDLFKPIVNLRAEGQPESIKLQWVKTNDTKYSSFNIFRSSDGNEFVKINQKPFSFFKSDGMDSDFITYTDSVDAGTTYYYKVYGQTPFGFNSEESLVVNATSTYPRIDKMFVEIADIEATMTEVNLTWELVEEDNFVLNGYNVYRSDNYDGTYTKLNTNILPTQPLSFTDNAPIAIGYYIVEGFDSHDYIYKSTPKMVSLPDSIPPNAPTGVVAQYYGNSRVDIVWDENSEEDLLGYRVEMSNHRYGTFIQITKNHIDATTYTHYTDPNVVSDSIFFRIFAQDKRGNYSQRSIAEGCKRPDIVPPAKPNFALGMASREGIKLGWSYSPTKSVISYKLLRKPVGTPTWTTVLSFPTEDKELYMPTDSTEYNYVDTTKLEYRPYEYSFIAEEAKGISAASNSMVVTPLPVVVTASTIKNFSISEELITGKPNAIIQQQIENLRTAQGSSRFNASLNTKHNIRLIWAYNLDPNVQDFQIYRAITGNEIILYRTITLAEAMGLDPNTEEVVVTEDMGLTDFSILDSDLMTGRTYTYQIVARHKDLSSTSRSMALSKRINP